MRIISQNGNFECDYEDVALYMIDGTIMGVLSKVQTEDKFFIAEYDHEDEAKIELSMLHQTYVKLEDGVGAYRFTAKETYRKARKMKE